MRRRPGAALGAALFCHQNVGTGRRESRSKTARRACAETLVFSLSIKRGMASRRRLPRVSFLSVKAKLIEKMKFRPSRCRNLTGRECCIVTVTKTLCRLGVCVSFRYPLYKTMGHGPLKKPNLVLPPQVASTLRHNIHNTLNQDHIRFQL